MIPIKRSINGYLVEISHHYDFEQLQDNWLAIQQDQDVPFFLTWIWISCWIETYSPKVVVVSASQHGRVVAIGLFTESIEKRHGFIRSRQYRLHQMGDQLLDQIWMEYNDFISIEEHRFVAVNACLQALQQSQENWDEIILSMMAASRARQLQKSIDNCHITLRIPSYATNLEAIAKDDDYLSTLKANTRYQIKRSIRIYQDLYGEVSLSVASSTEEALKFFRMAGDYHKQRWPDSGYHNPRFMQFHENLITKSFDQKAVDLIKITSGHEVIGILYLHLVNMNVFFYLHGLKYEEDNKLKPGLVSHALVTQYYLDQGMREYDYMGGDSQYKRQLACESEELLSLCIQRPQLMFYVEKIGRKIKKITKCKNVSEIVTQ